MMNINDLNINSKYIEVIKRQKYSVIGSHSAVKTCLWLKKSLYNIDSCYKSKFYNIQSHRCIQMTPSIYCNQKCIFCWRAIEFEEKKNIIWDSPEFIFNESIKSQLKLITGFGGSKFIDPLKYKESKSPKNVALSLIGEPTIYPYLDKLISLYNKENFTTFIVSNGTNPYMIKKITPTQLYISLDAPTEEIYYKICNPNSYNLWNNISKSLNILSIKKNNGMNTAIRITILKKYNFEYANKFVQLIEIALPKYIEVKSYMHIGFSRYRLNRENMTNTEDLIKFSIQICKLTNKYKIENISKISRVVLLVLIEQ